MTSPNCTSKVKDRLGDNLIKAENYFQPSRIRWSYRFN